jgi:transposase
MAEVTFLHSVSYVNDLSLRLVPDVFWEVVEPLVPQLDPRPHDGGTAPLEDRSVFTAIVYVLTSGCAWRRLPPGFGSASRPRIGGSPGGDDGVFDHIHRAVLDRIGAAGELDWSAAILDAAKAIGSRETRTVCPAILLASRRVCGPTISTVTTRKLSLTPTF